MQPYTIMTFSSHSASCDPFNVVVCDGADQPIVEMTAMSRQHAEFVAGGLMLLLQKGGLDRAIVLDHTVHSGRWRERAA